MTSCLILIAFLQLALNLLCLVCVDILGIYRHFTCIEVVEFGKSSIYLKYCAL